jgi:hypothetical protein
VPGAEALRETVPLLLLANREAGHRAKRLHAIKDLGEGLGNESFAFFGSSRAKAFSCPMLVLLSRVKMLD